MIGLDTNVLVRFLVRDDEVQFERAHELIRRESKRDADVFVSLLVLLETEWVLRSRYDLSKEQIADAFSALLSSIHFNFEDESSIEEALFVWKESNVQFADCLIGARHRALGCSGTATFDKAVLKLPGFAAV